MYGQVFAWLVAMATIIGVKVQTSLKQIIPLKGRIGLVNESRVSIGMIVLLQKRSNSRCKIEIYNLAK